MALERSYRIMEKGEGIFAGLIYSIDITFISCKMLKNRNQFIYGIHSIVEAIRAGKSLEKVFIKKGFKSDLLGELLRFIRKNTIPCQYVPVEKLNRLTRKNHQGIVALVSDIEYVNIEKIIPVIYEKGEVPFILILDRITDIRNFGAIARTAECAGVNAIVIPNKGVAQINSDAIKTSSGALHSISISRTGNLGETIKFLSDSGLQVFAVTEKAEDLYYGMDFTAPVALILGSEDKGINADLLKSAYKSVKIPMFGSIGSLNVSVAASIVIYEVVRQRQTRNI
jgi:23S rRNA (guanosine2251-2'-O)-methyltransferase